MEYLLLLLTISPIFIAALVDREDCGEMKLSAGRQGRIVNGGGAHFGEYPWQVGILTMEGFNNDNVHCGGSLINKEWVVTAAHCIYDAIRINFFPSRPMKTWYIILGDHNIKSDEEIYSRIVRKSSKLITHQQYQPLTFHYDVALIKLDRPVEYDKHIQPICLPTGNRKSKMIGEFVTATGWGKDFENGKQLGILQEVQLPILRNSVCEMLFKKAGEPTKLMDFFICSGYKNGKRDTCSGDSGGPLQYKAADGRWELVGIISWGYGCGRKYKPGLSTRVEKVLGWIKENIEEN